MKHHSATVDQSLDKMGVDPQQGLGDHEVQSRRAEYGANELSHAKRRGAWRILLQQFRSVVIVILALAGIAALVTARWVEAIAIAAVIVVNTVIGFVRVSPEQKLNLVDFYQQRGEPVAMTGDGVNNAPALKKAGIGIAMGQSGTDAAKQTADMILQDNSFETIVKAVEQGRIIFGNIRKAVVFMAVGRDRLVFGFTGRRCVPADLIHRATNRAARRHRLDRDPCPERPSGSDRPIRSRHPLSKW